MRKCPYAVTPPNKIVFAIDAIVTGNDAVGGVCIDDVALIADCTCIEKIEICHHRLGIGI